MSQRSKTGRGVGRSWRLTARALAAVTLTLAIGLGAGACTTGEDKSQAAASPNASDVQTGAIGASDAPSASASASGALSAATDTTDAPTADAVQTPAVDEGDGSPATLPPPLPNTINAAPSKVSRPGQPAKPSESADTVSFSAPVKYGDNTLLTITQASKQVETGNGPGVFAGREFVKFDLKLTNGSQKPIDLNTVVITTYYGDSNQLAAPVYTPSADTADFTGILVPGGTATASYGFAVPTSEFGDVTMVVDFDGVHSSATFKGSVSAS